MEGLYKNMKLSRRCLLRAICILTVLSVSFALYAQTDQAFQIGTIDFFGGQDMNTAALLTKIPVRVGQAVNVEEMDALQASIRSAILAATGKAATDVAVMCCDQPGRLQLYIGLQGSSYRASSYAGAPKGNATLPEDGLVLYRKDGDALAKAVQSGNSQEDDSNGYALTKDAPAHAVGLEMRAYALKHTAAIERVLQTSKDVEQRQAAATLLGYSQRSQEQVKNLVLAVNDADGDVRNNAVRALGVLAVAQPLVGLDVTPFVEMLYSGQWTDRNKSSLLLAHVTQSRDPILLDRLRHEAMSPLLDGAQWQSSGHAYFFLQILGRVGGIDEASLQKLIDSGLKDEIIAAAEKH